MPDHDKPELFVVDQVRFAAEVHLRREIAAHCDARRVSVPAPDYAWRRRELRARALLLTETIAPGAIRALSEAKSRLGVTRHVELYQANRYEGSRALLDHGNACMHFGEPPCIEILGSFLGDLDHGALVALFGHELGHLLAHGPESIDDLTWRRSDKLAWDGGLRLARELTADRFSLLACRDLDAALRTGMISIAGMVGSALNWDTRAYLTECQLLVQEILARGDSTRGRTHPEHGVRAYALWRFSESDVYRQLTREGSAARRLAEIDEDLAKLLPAGRIAPAPSPEPSAPPAPPPGPAPAAPAPPPVTTAQTASAAPDVMRLADAFSGVRAQMGKAMRELRTNLSAMLAPASPRRPPAPRAAAPSKPGADDPPAAVGDHDDPDDDRDDEEDELRAKFAELERRLAERDEKWPRGIARDRA
jgi:hypothetical protein